MQVIQGTVSTVLADPGVAHTHHCSITSNGTAARPSAARPSPTSSAGISSSAGKAAARRAARTPPIRLRAGSHYRSRTGAPTCAPFRVTHPELGPDRPDRFELGGVLIPLLQHQPDSTLPKLQGVLRRTSHDLHPSNGSGLRTRREVSHRSHRLGRTRTRHRRRHRPLQRMVTMAPRHEAGGFQTQGVGHSRRKGVPACARFALGCWNIWA